MRLGLGPWVAAVALAAGLAPSPLHAQALPPGFNVSGVARDPAGALRDGMFSMRVRLYAGETSSTVLLQEDHPSVRIRSGVFNLRVAESVDLAALLLASPEVWFTALVGSDSVELPRVRVGAVPAAFLAQQAITALASNDAAALGGVPSAGWQRALATPVPPLAWDASTRELSLGMCAQDGALLAWNGATGTWQCLSDYVAAPAPGSGLELSGRELSLLRTCNDKQVLAWNGTGWACADDADTFPANGSGLLLSGTTLSVDTTTIQARVSSSCAVGSSIRAIAADGTVTCENAALVAPRTVRTEDSRSGCPPAHAANTNLIAQSFTLARAGRVMIQASMIRAATGRVDLLLLVDGAVVDRALTYTPSNQWEDASLNWSGAVTAGAHTVSLRSATPNVWGCGAPWGAIDTIILE